MTVKDQTIPTGYKFTEVGIIPTDWEVSKIEDVSIVIGGGTPKTAIAEYWNGNINWFTPTEIGSSKYSSESNRKISNKGLENSSAKILPAGTILLTSRASIGDVSILTNEAATNQGFQSIIPNKNINNEFLYYIILTKKNDLLRSASGSTFLEISPKKVKSIKIIIPSNVYEQSRISTALSDADELITQLDELITKKKTIKQGAMQQLLTPKKDWEVKKIMDIGKVGRGRVISHREIDFADSKKYPVYSSQTSNDGVMGYLDTFDFEGEYITWTTDGENAGTVFYRQGKFNCTNVCGTIKLHKDNHKFIAILLNSVTSKYVSRNLANPKLMNDPMKKIEISIPKVEEQIRIATILADMDNEIKELEQKKAKYEQVKQGAMQQLLTGKIRLK